MLVDKAIDRLMEIKRCPPNNGFVIYNSIKYLRMMKRFIRKDRIRVACFSPYLHVTLNEAGELISCTPYRAVVGNLLERPLEELWDCEEFNSLRRRFKWDPVCENCFLTGDAEESLAYHPFEIIKRIRYRKKLGSLFKAITERVWRKGKSA